MPDPAFAQGWVESLYFDTPELDLLSSTLNGDGCKTKVRLRWYPGCEQDGGRAPIRAWLEIKKRNGKTRTKTRQEVSLMLTPAATPPLDATSPMGAGCSLAWDVDSVRQALHRSAPEMAARLHPMLVVRYHRARFLEPRTGSRIAIDTEIEATAYNRTFLRPTQRPELGRGVVEVKGIQRELPSALAILRGLGCSDGSFSKYALCHRRFQHD